MVIKSYCNISCGNVVCIRTQRENAIQLLNQEWIIKEKESVQLLSLTKSYSWSHKHH